MPVPDFSPGEVLTAAAMDSIGLWLVKTQTVGTGVSSVTVTGAFSANYDRYRITIDNIAASTGGDLRFQLGSANTQYYGIYNYQVSTGTTQVFYQNNTANAYIGGLATSGSQGEQSITFDISQPNKATRTAWTGQAFGNNYYFNFGYQLADTTQYTAFTIFPGSGTLTGGTIRVYGYRN
jgi:hypothetical protein